MAQTKRGPTKAKGFDLSWLEDIPTKVVDGRVVVDREAVLKRFPPGYDLRAATRGMFADGPSLTQALLEGRKEDRALEERKSRRFD